MKQKLRQKYKTLRQSLSKTDRKEGSKAIFSKLKNEFNLIGKTVSVFIPIDRFNEVNTWELIDNTAAEFYLPVMTGDGLKHIQYQSKTLLKANHWGILEPESGKEISANQFDVVIVPLLAFDQKGSRVGYGKGFYDGFLKDCNKNCKFIGVSFFEVETEIINTYPTDIPVHFCITPKTVYKF